MTCAVKGELQQRTMQFNIRLVGAARSYSLIQDTTYAESQRVITVGLVNPSALDLACLGSAVVHAANIRAVPHSSELLQAGSLPQMVGAQ